MLITFVHFQFGVKCPPETVVRDHSFDRMFNQQLWPAIPTPPSGLRFVSADKSGKTRECLLNLLFSSQSHLFRVNDDHEVTRVDVRGKYGLPFPAKQVRH